MRSSPFGETTHCFTPGALELLMQCFSAADPVAELRTACKRIQQEQEQDIRIDKVTLQNAFIDFREWNRIIDKDNIPAALRTDPLPPIHEWASVSMGSICVFPKNRSMCHRAHAAAETAFAVIGCAELLDSSKDQDYAFGGICHSNLIHNFDDVVNGMKREYFTVQTGGSVKVFNDGGGNIQQGDLVEWTFFDETSERTLGKRRRAGPVRRIQVRTARDTHERVFGKALTNARRGEVVDILLGPPPLC